MAKRIYTKYKPQKPKPQKKSRGKWGLLLVLGAICGVSWWAAATGKIVLPGQLQKLIATNAGEKVEKANRGKDLPPIPKKPVGAADFGTQPGPPVPPPPPLKTIAPKHPKSGAATNPPVKIDVALPPPQAESEEFQPRSAWSMFEVQLALARNAISPGILDGLSGPQTLLAIQAFQRKIGLPPSGKPNLQTKSRLLLSLPPYTGYTVTEQDLASLQPTGKTWQAKAGQSAMAYESVLELVAEKSHSFHGFIEKLNPAVDWENVKAGTRLKVPSIQYPPPTSRAAFLRISLTNKVVQAFDAQTNLLAHFPCSIARKVEKRPLGELKIVNFAADPNYTFDPLNFPPESSARQIGTKLTIQPGPNNPVGTAWIGLDRPGYGIHGTPLPAKIGRTESLGCFRLANWDAYYLLKLISRETTVFVES